MMEIEENIPMAITSFSAVEEVDSEIGEGVHETVELVLPPTLETITSEGMTTISVLVET